MPWPVFSRLFVGSDQWGARGGGSCFLSRGDGHNAQWHRSLRRPRKRRAPRPGRKIGQFFLYGGWVAAQTRVFSTPEGTNPEVGCSCGRRRLSRREGLRCAIPSGHRVEKDFLRAR